MHKKTSLVALVAATVVAGGLGNVALASGGTGGGGTGGGGTGGGGTGGGGTTTTTLPTPAIAPGTFDGIGPGPVYVHDSFGFAQTTRYKQDGSIVDVGRHPEVNAIRAEYGNNKTESWIGPNVTTGGSRFQFATVGGAGGLGDPYEQYTPLQDNSAGFYQDGILMLSAEPGAADTRPDALIPFPAPVTSPSTLSGDTVPNNAKTAIGFSTSSAANANFETNGQVWLQVDCTPRFPPGNLSNPCLWDFHTNGLSGATLSGSYMPDGTAAANGFDRLAISYDPVNHVAMATIDGNVIASVTYTAQTIKYAGVEGTNNGANIDNVNLWAGNATDPMPASIAAPATPANTKF